MKLLFDKRDKAGKHTVAKGDTLKSIADKYKAKGGDFPPDLSWEDLAIFNWATSTPREVTRALCERIGSADPGALRKGLAPETLKLDPAFGPSGAKEILAPKLWKADALELQKTHTLKVRQHMPAVAVGFVSLDKWFIPDVESCEAEYALEGEAACADQVDCEVYGSNYCSLKAWNDGLPTFTPLPDAPIWKQPASASQAAARSAPKITGWKGLANCTVGLLAPGRPAGARPLNVAFSPYSMVLRYYKKTTSKPADKTARIDLEPFWLSFDAHGRPATESCKVKWKVKGTDRLKLGLLQIADNTGAVVYMKPLAAADLAKDAAKEFAWNGKHADGADASAANMPYRVKIDAHSDIDETEGLAIAVMHTEVRLFVHKDTHPLDLDPYVAETDKVSLDLSIADLYHKNKDPQQSEGKLRTKFALAQAGFHPGPVNDGGTNAEFESALGEFQRSVPKNPAGPAPYERLAITQKGDDDKNTKAALAKLNRERWRPWFGKPADRSDWTDQVDGTGKVTQEFRKNPAFLADLRDPTKSMIVWVDDRNWYTDCKMIEAAEIRSIVTSDPADLGNKRGEMNAGDLRVGYDANDIARPWIPLQVDFRLLGKANSLGDEVAAETDPIKAESIRRAIGPLRVEWSFDEIEVTAAAAVTLSGAAQNLQLPTLDAAVDAELADLYHDERSRTRIALRWALDRMKAEYDRKDIHKRTKYYNAAESCGGIRPAALAQYFSKPFGVDAESLLPYKAKTSARETVYTVTHDRLGQPPDSFFSKRQGRAGVYFHPSRIAGDGYRIRAQVWFDPETDYQFPNLAALKARYPKLPQAQSARLRLWRKTTIRGYVSWGPANSWTAAPAAPA